MKKKNTKKYKLHKIAKANSALKKTTGASSEAFWHTSPQEENSPLS